MAPSDVSFRHATIEDVVAMAKGKEAFPLNVIKEEDEWKVDER